tara:strand:+ start:19794 stop:20033 length:240 start_codon:yes stop_codon:yes gene_type:complete
MNVFTIVVSLLWFSPEEKFGLTNVYEITHRHGNEIKFDTLEKCFFHVEKNYNEIIISVSEEYKGRAMPIQIFCKNSLRT